MQSCGCCVQLRKSLRALASLARAWHVCAGSEGLQRMRGALLDSFRVADGVSANPGQYTAATELLLIALSHHPSLVDMMLFPTGLQGSQEKVSLSVVTHLAEKYSRRRGHGSTFPALSTHSLLRKDARFA